MLLAISACVPYLNPPLSEIPKLGSLKEIMDAQATIADPHWSRIGDEAFTDADFASFQDLSVRMAALATRAQNFSDTPRFDELAAALAEEAQLLGDAASTKDPQAVSSALSAMKATCRKCHAELR